MESAGRPAEFDKPKFPPPRYSNRELLELLSLYEGELQAREALLDLYQWQQGACASSLAHLVCSSSACSSHCSSSAALLPSTSSSSSAASVALLRDSQFAEDGGGHSAQCVPCPNALLHSAKIIQRQRNWELKIVKIFSLLKKRYLEGKEELEGRQRRMELMAEENGQYVKHLETERDQLLVELTQCKKELAELFEQRTNVEEQLEAERERTRLMVTYLVDEAQRHRRKQRDDGDAEGKRTTTHIRMAQQPPPISSKPSQYEIVGDNEWANNGQMRFFRDENDRLLSTVGVLKAEKAALKKRLDQLQNDQQQQNNPSSEQRQKLQTDFLKQSKLSLSRAEQPKLKQQQQQLFTLHDNGFIVCPPPQQPKQQKQQQKQTPLLFPPLPPQPPTTPSAQSAAPSPTAPAITSPAPSACQSQMAPSFLTIPPRPPTIRASASFPLHLGSCSSSPASHSSASSSPPATADAVFVGGGGAGDRKRPSTAPAESSSRRTHSSCSGTGRIMFTGKGIGNGQQQHTHQFPVTDSDWMRAPPVAADHRVVVPLMGTNSANFSRSSAAVIRHHPPLPPMPRTSVATIPRSPQHRRTTIGATIEQKAIGVAQGHHHQQQQPQQTHQQQRVGIGRRSSSLPRRMMSGVAGGTASASLPMGQHFPPANSPHQNHQQLRQYPPSMLQHNHHQQQQQFICQQNDNGSMGGVDKYSHFL